MKPSGRIPTIAIVGGGFTGAAVAFHLAGRTSAGSLRIELVEPREAIGAGLAYSATDPAHRINVPAAKMSLIPEEPSHFADWLGRTGALQDDPAAISADGSAFPQRRVFGRYVADALQGLLDSGRIIHRRDRVGAIGRTARGFVVSTDAGPGFSADVVVLAATHPRPAIPPALAHLANADQFITDVYAPAALSGVRSSDRVLIVGNGLTSADIVASLDARGHAGRIVALSRHGLRSMGHPPVPVPARGDFSRSPERKAGALLSRIRGELTAAAAAGETWHSVLDAVRD
jgi:uncharacterized NAD(P)/FAD-binding protein YdhS